MTEKQNSNETTKDIQPKEIKKLKLTGNYKFIYLN